MSTITRLACLSLCLCLCLCFGCGRQTPELTIEDAQTALLDLMRIEDSPFEGADPDVFEDIDITENNGDYHWGAFSIDTNSKTYVANVESDVAF